MKPRKIHLLLQQIARSDLSTHTRAKKKTRNHQYQQTPHFLKSSRTGLKISNSLQSVMARPECRTFDGITSTAPGLRITGSPATVSWKTPSNTCDTCSCTCACSGDALPALISKYASVIPAV